MDTDLSKLQQQVLAMGSGCYALQARRTANQLARSYNRALSPLGLEISQFSTLCMIAADQVESVSEMAMHLGVERSTLVRNLKLLERDGLVTQRAREQRRVRYRLTPEGTTLLGRALPIWHEVQARMRQAMETLEPYPALRSLRQAAAAIAPEAGS